MHIVPQHFIYANLKDAFKVRVYSFKQYSSNTKLVDIEARRVSIVKDLRMPEPMGRRAVETLFTTKAAKPNDSEPKYILTCHN
jgi:hypothetical protein